MNLRDLINGINVICVNYPTIQEFGEGDIYNYLNTGEHKYPCTFLTISNISVGENDTQTISGSLFYVDRLLNDSSNRLNIQSVAISTLKVIADKIEENIQCTMSVSEYQPFTEQFGDWCAGAYSTFDLEFTSSVDCGEYDELNLTVKENGVYNAIGYNKVIVSVPVEGVTESWVRAYTYDKTTIDGKIPSLDGYATESWVEGKGYLTEHQSLTEYAKKTDIPTIPTNVSAFTNDAGYLTEHQSLEDYALKSWVEGKGYLTEHQSLAEYAKKSEIPSLEGYATESWVEGKGYLTEHQSLAEYAKKSEIPSLEGYATEYWVEGKGYLTEHQSLKTINNQSIIGSGNIEIEGGGVTMEQVDREIDTKLTGYATESWVEGKGYLTEHQSLADYAKKSDIPSLEEYALKSWVEGKGYLTEHQSLADYAKKSDIPTVPTNVSAFNNDAGYLTEHQSLADYAKKSDIPSLEEYALKSWVEGKGYLTEHQSLAEYAKKSEIPSLEGYATESWVESKNYLTEHQSLTDYALKSWVEGKGYLTEHQSIKTVNNQSLIGTGNIEISGGLSPEQLSILHPELNPEKGLLYTKCIDSRSFKFIPLSYDNFLSDANKNMGFVGDDIYTIDNSYYTGIYKFNKETLSFDLLFRLSSNISQGVVWSDNSGTMYVGVEYKIDLQSKTAENVSLGISNYEGRYGRLNVIKTESDIYSIDGTTAYKYNETSKVFELIQSIEGSEYIDTSNLGRNLLYYEDKILYISYGSMYEFKVDGDSIGFVSVSEPYFDCSFVNYGCCINKVGSDYYYIWDFEQKKLVNGSWENIGGFPGLTTNASEPKLCVGDSLFIGGVVFQDEKPSGFWCINPTETDIQTTYWEKENSIVVDLTSYQKISGTKTFKDGIISSSVNSNTYGSENQSNKTNISFYKSSVKTDYITIEPYTSGNESIPFIVCGKDVATTDKLILNRKHIGYGNKYKKVSDGVGWNYGYAYFITKSGNLFCANPGSNEMWHITGGDLNIIYTSVIIQPVRVANIADGTYVIGYDKDTYERYLYKFDEENKDWTQLCDGAYGTDNLWASGTNSLRLGNEYKVVNTDGTYTIVSDPINFDMTSEHISVVCNGVVYIFEQYSNNVYVYDESTKNITLYGNINRYPYFSGYKPSVTVCGTDILYVDGYKSVQKIDTTITTERTYVNESAGVDVDECEYLFISTGDKTYVTNSSGCVGYIYGSEETLPEIDTTKTAQYNLSANVGSDGSVTYSWKNDIFIGTQDEWDNLPAAEKAKYKLTFITE